MLCMYFCFLLTRFIPKDMGDAKVVSLYRME